MRVYLATLFVGLAVMGAGLWLFAPWLSLTVIGALVFGGSVLKLNRR